MRYWKKLPTQAIKRRVFEALGKNVDFGKENILGVPASYLDDKVFNQDHPWLRDSPFLSTLIHNPNHIGCHTLGESEQFFRGTQELERELIELCAVDILGGNPGEQDGYVASGGTEANIQAVWIYRNYFMRKFGARLEEIAILCSADNHYSVQKAANLLHLQACAIQVDEADRQLLPDDLEARIEDLRGRGVGYFIVVANMITTMFGSVDDPDLYADALEAAGVQYRLHVDGAYGGFVYPFSGGENRLNFRNPCISSIALDAHKMLQAPYGTGIFLIRKGLMENVYTEEASYVKGLDATLVGSRSGANAIAVWMILMTYGPFGWKEKVHVLQYRTQWLCRQLDELGVTYYRHPRANIVSIRADQLPRELAEQYYLVPDNHHAPQWYKIVVMDHVTIDKLHPFVQGLEKVRVRAAAGESL